MYLPPIINDAKKCIYYLASFAFASLDHYYDLTTIIWEKSRIAD